MTEFKEAHLRTAVADVMEKAKRDERLLTAVTGTWAAVAARWEEAQTLIRGLRLAAWAQLLTDRDDPWWSEAVEKPGALAQRAKDKAAEYQAALRAAGWKNRDPQQLEAAHKVIGFEISRSGEGTREDLISLVHALHAAKILAEALGALDAAGVLDRVAQDADARAESQASQQAA